MVRMVVQVEDRAVTRRRRFEEAGFVEDGTLVEFHRDADADADQP